MLGFRKTKPANEWQQWIAKRQAQQEALASLTAQKHEANREREEAEQQAYWGKMPLLEMTGYPVRNTPMSQLPKAAEVVRRVSYELEQQRALRAKGLSFEWNLNQVSKALAALQTLVEQMSAAKQRFESLEAQEKEQQEALAAIESRPPKAGHNALEAFDGEIHAVREELEQVDKTLEAMEDGQDSQQRANANLVNAQALVDELEGAAALGNDNLEEQSKAQTALEKAQGNIEQAAKQVRRQQAARRGLERKRSQLVERLEELGQMHADIARDVYVADLESQETRLVSLLGGDDIRQLVESINATRRQLNQAIHHGESRQPSNSPHSPLRVSVEFKHLEHHPDRKQLGHRLEL